MTKAELLILNLPSIICFIAGFVLAFIGAAGWGWFLVVGLLVTTSFTKSNKQEEDNEHQKV